MEAAVGVLSEELQLRSGAARYKFGRMINRSLFRYFKTSPGIIRLAVMLCTRFPAVPTKRRGSAA
jgi:hypothetical protein